VRVTNQTNGGSGLVGVEQRWTNECVEVPRLEGGEHAETEIEWVRRVAIVASERRDRRLVGVTFPLQHRGIDLALVCFSAPHMPYYGAPDEEAEGSS
jgi:hypothetical protein